METTLDPEKIHKVQNFVRELLQGLDALPECDRISLLEQATGCEQVGQELRMMAAANAQSRDLRFWAKNAIE